MKLSEVKSVLENLNDVNFELPDGTLVPQHFHVTEVGMVNKHFIDCGGTVRNEKNISFQLWEANDFDHRLKPQKLNSIINLSIKTLNLEDLDVEVEYQGTTIGKYSLGFNGKNFTLIPLQTNCLATDKCGIPTEKLKMKLSELSPAKNSCKPGSGCC